MSATFTDLFTFARASSAPYTDVNGQAQIAPPNTPRFDYAGGQPLGLLVQGFAETNAPDQVAVASDAWRTTATTGTVLHTYQTPQGAIVRQAVYTNNPRAVMSDLLRSKGWHRRITFVPVQLPASNNQVGWGGAAYALPGALVGSLSTRLAIAAGGAPLSTGTDG